MTVDVLGDVVIEEGSVGRVSTTLVREKLEAGQVELVEKMLGRRYHVDGYVLDVDEQLNEITCGEWSNALPGRGLYEASVRVRLAGPGGEQFRAKVDVTSQEELVISMDPKKIQDFVGLQGLELSVEFIEGDFHF